MEESRACKQQEAFSIKKNTFTVETSGFHLGSTNASTCREGQLDENARRWSTWADHRQAVPEPRRAPRRPAWSAAHVCLSTPNTVTKEHKLHETQSPFQAIILVKFRTGSKKDNNRISSSGNFF